MFEAEREKVRVSEIAPVDDDEVGDRVVTACLDGASERAIAKRFGISVREVRQLVTERLASRNPEDHALEVGVEVARITQMQARLYAMTLAADDPTTMCSCAAVWNRLSE